MYMCTHMRKVKDELVVSQEEGRVEPQVWGTGVGLQILCMFVG